MVRVPWDEKPGVLTFQLALLSRARELGIKDIGPTKMLGLLYLIDVEHVTRYGEQATDVSWRWMDFGPFDSDAAYALRSDDRVEKRPFGGPYEGSVFSLVVDDSFDLEIRLQAVLVDVMNEHGRKTGSTIKAYCYRETEPMRRVQATGSRGDYLEMLSAGNANEPDPETMQHLTNIVEAIEPTRPDSNDATDSLAALVDETAELRRRATSDLIRHSTA